MTFNESIDLTNTIHKDRMGPIDFIPQNRPHLLPHLFISFPLAIFYPP